MEWGTSADCVWEPPICSVSLHDEAGSLLLLRGRRRSLQNCIESALFFTADLSFGEPILGQIKPFMNLPSTLKISSWDEFFGMLKNLLEFGKDLNVVVFDEFQYIQMRDESFMSILQRRWDEVFSKLNVKMTLCGSYIGMIEKIALTQNSPVYGRRTGQYPILPLDFFDSMKFLSFEKSEDYRNIAIKHIPFK
ncbi:MAG: hypothetical protein WHT65_08555 [Pseudothermotoga sp.]